MTLRSKIDSWRKIPKIPCYYPFKLSLLKSLLKSGVLCSDRVSTVHELSECDNKSLLQCTNRFDLHTQYSVNICGFTVLRV
jgi:hypothetical protein